MALIVSNGVIRQVTLLTSKPLSSWIIVWPFAVLYLIQVVLYNDPELVWDKITYLIYRQYIDFFHAVCFPLLIFFHAFLCLFTVWSVKFKARVQFVTTTDVVQATHILIQTHAHKGDDTIERIQRSAGGVFFVFQQRKWKYADAKSQFVKPHFPTKHSFEHYAKWKGLLTAAQVEEAIDQFGENRMTITVPEFTELFVDHALAPFFVFQMFCVLLWCLDEYWMTSLFTGFMMIVMECTVIMQRIRNSKTLRQMAEVPPSKVYIYRQAGRVEQVDSNKLLPMDLIVVPNNAPCPVDAVIVSGTSVVNEATLTGESTPQLKEAIDVLPDINLEVKRHSRHILFAGTEILLASGSTVVPQIGLRGQALAVVIKNGFETKQGKLLRTILHSQGRMSENSGEAFGFIGALVVFALAASGYLLRRGLEDPNRSRWKLFLSCTQIITAVVPPELPMELSLAVNASLLALVKLRVFCTEPFRIPFAGKVDTCCFDKTGTLTTDEMLFAGIDACDGEGIRGKLDRIPQFAEMVLAGCHSLVNVDGQLAGDAMEKAALGALQYKVTKEDTVSKESKGGQAITARILARFPFIASLRRMSTIVTVSDDKYVVCKGSAESVHALCKSVPANYEEIHLDHARRGFRVIALAYRTLTQDERSHSGIANAARDSLERDLTFCGLAIFQCPLKKDAKETIENLQGGSHRCVIITGDSVETAISVGADVSLLQSKRRLISYARAEGAAVQWRDALTRKEVDPRELHTKTFRATRRHATPSDDEWDLCVNAETLTSDQFATIVADVGHLVAVWARCAPSQKEDIVSDLKRKGHIVLMAGDGTNDVGALKQAHTGIAVLNSAAVTPQPEKVGDKKPTAANTGAVVAANQDADIPAGLVIPPNFKLTPIPAPLGPKAGFMDNLRHQTALATRKVQLQHLQKLADAQSKNKKDNAAISPVAAAKENPSEFLMQSMFNEDDESTGGAPMVKLGDASIAAPFTCKSKALMSVCDIVRMGRSTLVTTLQMYKILALNCLTTAYSMSVLSSDGVRLGDKQMMVSGVIMSICFLCMSRSQPLQKLSPQRPITRVFHPYMVCSILGQFSLHLYSLISSVALVAAVDAAAVLAQRNEPETSEFRPTLLNSIVYLMTTLMAATTFAVNYRGEPFMQSITKNRPMFYALCVLVFMVFYLASEADPDLNEYLEIVKFPSDDFRNELLSILAVDMFGAFAIEKFFLWTMTDA
jgi:manganese-transporting P-type ATPase